MVPEEMTLECPVNDVSVVECHSVGHAVKPRRVSALVM